MDFIVEIIGAITSTAYTVGEYSLRGINKLRNYYSQGKKEKKEVEETFNDLEKRIRGED